MGRERRRLGRWRRRSVFLSVRLRADEAATVARQARASGVGVSELARRVLLAPEAVEPLVAQRRDGSA